MGIQAKIHLDIVFEKLSKNKFSVSDEFSFTV